MPTATVRIELPFYLCLEDSMRIPYTTLCDEPHVAELEEKEVHIGFDFVQRRIDNSGMTYPRTVVIIQISADELPETSVDAFAIRDCLRIVNRIIAAYQAVTGQISNAGFISPLGVADIQLFADIRVDERNVRDRWPGHNISTFRLSAEQLEQFDTYLRGADMPLPRLFLTSALLMLSRGQYSLSIVQAATAVELRLTTYISLKLRTSGWSDAAIQRYEKKTLGQKLDLPKGDPRSLKTYYGRGSDFPALFAQLGDPLNRLRNRVIHRGHLASLDEARQVLGIARPFLELVRL